MCGWCGCGLGRARGSLQCSWWRSKWRRIVELFVFSEAELPRNQALAAPGRRIPPSQHVGHLLPGSDEVIGVERGRAKPWKTAQQSFILLLQFDSLVSVIAFDCLIKTSPVIKASSSNCCFPEKVPFLALKCQGRAQEAPPAELSSPLLIFNSQKTHISSKNCAVGVLG